MERLRADPFVFGMNTGRMEGEEIMVNEWKSPLGIKLIIGFLVLCSVVWIVGQGGAVVSYDSVADRGFQQRRETIDPIIVEVNQGIALGDVLIHLPLFIVGIVGLWRRKAYGAVAAWMAMASHLYWITVAWSKNFYHLRSTTFYEPIALSLHIGMVFIVLFSLWAIWYLFRKRSIFRWER